MANKYTDRRDRIRWNLLMHPGKGETAAAQALAGAGLLPVRQYCISGYFVDIALPDHRLVIEIDGDVKLKRGKERHRQLVIERAGWCVLRCSSMLPPSRIVERVRAAIVSRPEPEFWVQDSPKVVTKTEPKVVSPALIIRRKRCSM